MAKSSNITGIEQGRASYAYKCAVQGQAICITKDGEQIEEYIYNDKNYKQYVKKIPMYIKTNGIGATLAFIFSKKAKSNSKKNAWDLIYLQIKNYTRDYLDYLFELDDNIELVDKVVSLNSKEYRMYTIEILALFTWIRRFAEGLIKEDGSEDVINEQLF